MDKKKWISKTKALMRKAGTYEKHYDAAIDALADILVQRDAVHEKYIEEGAIPVVVHINRGGAENATKNPLLTLWMDLNTQALAYWRDLGLTPASLKKITGEVTKEEKGSGLVAALKHVESGSA